MFDANDSLVLDKIIEARYTCRSFSDEIPKTEDIESIIKAGQLAPYASISSKDVDVFRHFYVMFRGDERLKIIDRLIREQSMEDLRALEEEEKENEFLLKNDSLLKIIWNDVAQRGASVFPDPPCLIVAAEWRGARRAERQSLAHAIQNMWLKATALNYDFNILSIVESMVSNQEFCDLFGLSTGKYGFHACVIGKCKEKTVQSTRATSEVHWL
ncbi:MAG: nitroreductase family protein [Agathobacter sp.]